MIGEGTQVRDVAVVTGAASGIGLATAQRLAADGMLVVGVDRTMTRASTMSENFVLGDVREEDTHRAAAEVAIRLGHVTTWVNCAGVIDSTPLHLASLDEMRSVLDVNLLGVALGIRAALRLYLRQGLAGAIVNISSVHALRPFPGSPCYDASKAGIDALTRYVCSEYGHLGVRCNSVAPGAVDTDMTRSLEVAPSAREATLLLSPMRRISTEDEVAEIVRFLVSPEAQSINGHTLVADNGLLARGPGAEPAESVRFST